MQIRFGSICSGIEAASVAWEVLGWQAAWFSEIEPFPCAVLKHHYPSVPNYGDMTGLPERILSGEIEAPDVLVGGTPCQAFSVAGLRNSLEDARGNLSLVFIRIANAIDHVRSINGKPPCVIVWENVPGVYSTKDNAFGSFLAGLADEDSPLLPAGGKWTNAGAVFSPKRTTAWRTLDAQFFGVAQRRRRCFVVSSARTGFNPHQILFEFEGVRRDTAPSREAGKGTSASAKSGVDANGIQHTVGTLCADTHPGAYSGQDAYTGRLVPQVFEMHGQDSRVRDVGKVCTTVTSKYGTGGGNVPVTVQAISIHPHCIGRAPESGPQGKEYLLDGSAYCMDSRGQPQAVASAMAVRRLTPIECERLQGFPDNYTDIPWRKQPNAPDGPRYKALGNSMAVTVMRWIGTRIDRAVNFTVTADNDNNQFGEVANG